MNSKKLVQISLFSKCKFLKHDWDRLIHLIYPRRCPVCGKIVGSSPGKPVQYVHSGCLGKLKWVCEPCCLKCGKPVASPVQAYCFDCTRRPKSFDGGISGFIQKKCPFLLPVLNIMAVRRTVIFMYNPFFCVMAPGSEVMPLIVLRQCLLII